MIESGRDRLPGAVNDLAADMVLQVPADAGQVHHHIHTSTPQVIGRAHPRKEEQVGRSDGSCGQHHFGGGRGQDEFSAGLVLDPDAAAVADEEALGPGPGRQMQVRTIQDRDQVASVTLWRRPSIIVRSFQKEPSWCWPLMSGVTGCPA